MKRSSGEGVRFPDDGRASKLSSCLSVDVEAAETRNLVGSSQSEKLVGNTITEAKQCFQKKLAWSFFCVS